MSPKQRLSWYETAGMFLVTMRIVGNALQHCLSFPFSRSHRLSFRDTLINAAARSLGAGATLNQLKFLTPPAEEYYNAFAREKGFEPDILRLEDGTKAYRLPNSVARKTLLHTPAGAFAVEPTDSNFKMLWENIVQNPELSVEVLILDHDHTPEHIYPRQLQQIARLLNHLLHVENLLPSSILLGGDSSGAMLTASLLSHLVHPHPSLDIPRISLDGPLCGAYMLYGHWDFNFDRESVRSNADIDIMTRPILEYWFGFYMGDNEPDNWNQPGRAASEWWTGLEKIISRLLLVSGSNEILLDDVVEQAEKIGSVHSSVKLVIAEGEAHEANNLALKMGWPMTKTLRELIEWLKEVAPRP